MLMQKSLSLITFVTLASAPSLLLAEGENAYCPEHLDAEVETLGHVCKGAYAGIGIGTSILDPKFDGTDDKLTGKAHLVLPNIYLGYNFNQNWGSELHYTRQGQAKFESGAGVDYSYLGLSGLYHYTLPNIPEVNGFFKLGVGKLMTSLASEPDDGTKVDFEQVKDFQLHFGFGAEYIRLDGLGGRIEWLSSDDDSSEINFTVLKQFAKSRRRKSTCVF